MVAVAAPALYLAWWLGSPLLIDDEVDEAFPLSASAVIPAGTTREEAETTMEEAAELEREVAEARMEAMAAATVLKSGTFEGADAFHSGEGTATIYQLDDGSYVLRFEDFRVTNGPDLRVILSPHPNPEGRGDVTAAGYIEIGRLKGNVGPQNYFFPQGVTPDEFQSVIIYCRPFHVVFSVAALSEG